MLSYQLQYHYSFTNRKLSQISVQAANFKPVTCSKTPQVINVEQGSTVNTRSRAESPASSLLHHFILQHYEDQQYYNFYLFSVVDVCLYLCAYACVCRVDDNVTAVSHGVTMTTRQIEGAAENRPKLVKMSRVESSRVKRIPCNGKGPLDRSNINATNVPELPIWLYQLPF